MIRLLVLIGDSYNYGLKYSYLREQLVTDDFSQICPYGTGVQLYMDNRHVFYSFELAIIGPAITDRTVACSSLAASNYGHSMINRFDRRAYAGFHILHRT